jgi:hypothetical protein
MAKRVSSVTGFRFCLYSSHNMPCGSSEGAIWERHVLFAGKKGLVVVRDVSSLLEAVLPFGDERRVSFRPSIWDAGMCRMFRESSRMFGAQL